MYVENTRSSRTLKSYAIIMCMYVCRRYRILQNTDVSCYHYVRTCMQRIQDPPEDLSFMQTVCVCVCVLKIEVFRRTEVLCKLCVCAVHVCMCAC